MYEMPGTVQRGRDYSSCKRHSLHLSQEEHSLTYVGVGKMEKNVQCHLEMNDVSFEWRSFEPAIEALLQWTDMRGLPGGRQGSKFGRRNYCVSVCPCSGL